MYRRKPHLFMGQNVTLKSHTKKNLRNLKLSSAYSSSLEESKTCLLGKG